QPDAGGGGGGGGGEPDAGGGGGGGSADECAGLSPAAVGAPSASVGLSAGRFEICRTGSSDGFGVVALIVDSRFDVIPRRSSVFLFDSSGNSRGTYSGPDQRSPGDPAFTFLTEQLAGFELRNWDPDTGSEVVAIDGTGSVVGSTRTINAVFVLVAIDPLGGVVVSSVPRDSSPTRAIAAYDDRARLHEAAHGAGRPGLRGDFAPAPDIGRRVPGHDRSRRALGKDLWHRGIPGRAERL